MTARGVSGRMDTVRPPDQVEELEHPDDVLLRELQRMDELLLEELERVDEMLLRIVADIDQLPERVVPAIRRGQPGSAPGNGARPAEPARSRDPGRPFDPHWEEGTGAAAAEEPQSAAGQVAEKLQSWIAGNAQGRDPLRVAALSVAIALLATALAVAGLIVAVLH